MSTLTNSWGAFSPDVASAYLKTHGHPSLRGRELLKEVLQELSRGTVPSIVDFGCGNAQIYEYFHAEGFRCRYTGVDFSDPLLEAARRSLANLPDAVLLKDDVDDPKLLTGTFDFAIYSHVIEMLSCPESSLLRAKQVAKKIVIRFFEPPEFDVDTVELREMDVGGKMVPYLRRKMSRDYYRLILTKLGCKSVDVYRDEHAKDQIHVLHY